MADKSTKKTNAARLLDQLKVSYELIPYEVDESDLGAAHIAEQLGQPIERLFKTLVLRGDKTGLLCASFQAQRRSTSRKRQK